MSSPNFTIIEHTFPCSYIREYPRATASAKDEKLSICVKQYVPKNNPNPAPGDVTILATHGSGLPKELYEPLWDDLLWHSESSGLRIRSIWIADMCHQGASGVLNEDKLGNDPSWFDHCRDLLSLVNHFRDEMPRPIMGIGHSMGAAQLVLLSMMHPRLLASIVLLDPVMGKCTRTCQAQPLTKLSTFRRELWDSREEAEAAARKSYKKWDKRVLDRWMSYGLRETPTALFPLPKAAPSVFKEAAPKPVTLTTTKHQEVFSYLRPNFNGSSAVENPDQDNGKDIVISLDSQNRMKVDRLFYPDIVGPPGTIEPFYRAELVVAYHALPYLRASILYVFGDESPVSTPELRRLKMSRTGLGPGGSGGAPEGRVREVLLPGAGHLVPMEAVSQCAKAAAEWCALEAARWKANEERIAHGWTEKSLRERSTVSQEWTDKVRALL